MPRFQQLSCGSRWYTAQEIVLTDSSRCSNGFLMAGQQYFFRMISPLGEGHEDTSTMSHMQSRWPRQLIMRQGAFTMFVKNRAHRNSNGKK